ncbi:hypothetical protein FOXYSP1_10207 [Fusarium oxysporum f. sp. phaseoli]
MVLSWEALYSIVCLALVALTLVGTVILFLSSIWLAPRHKDPARNAFLAVTLWQGTSNLRHPLNYAA